ncbi:hypothetical protein MTO96_036948 [Rhipicephalus appendiculatus]
MKKILAVLSVLVAVYAISAPECPVLGFLESHLQSRILPWYALFSDALTTTLFQVARAYEFLSLLISSHLLHTSHKQYFGKIPPLSSGSVYQRPTNAASDVVPYALADMMRGILTDYEADAAFFPRRPEKTRLRDVVVLINKAGWPVDTPQTRWIRAHR